MKKVPLDRLLAFPPTDFSELPSDGQLVIFIARAIVAHLKKSIPVRRDSFPNWPLVAEMEFYPDWRSFRHNVVDVHLAACKAFAAHNLRIRCGSS